MSWVRLGVALVFAGLYAAVILRELATGGDFSGLAPLTPVATLAVTYLLGMEAVKALRNGRKDDDAA
jgi:hypothetical protein